MNYLTMAGLMECMEENPAHREHIIQYTHLIEQAIKDLTPQILKEELAKMDVDMLVKIQTQINGRNIDFPDVREYIRRMIEEELRKALKEIRL